MLKFCFLLGLFLLPVVNYAEDLRPVIRREARKCAAAWQRSDYETILSYLPPQHIKRAGGRAASLKKIKNQYDRIHDFGVESMELSAGTPAAPRLIGRWHTSLIPLTVVLRRTPVDVTQVTHLLGLSDDQGKRWFFVPLYNTTQAELEAWYPEFAGKLIVPHDPEPEFGFGF